MAFHASFGVEETVEVIWEYEQWHEFDLSSGKSITPFSKDEMASYDHVEFDPRTYEVNRSINEGVLAGDKILAFCIQMGHTIM